MSGPWPSYIRQRLKVSECLSRKRWRRGSQLPVPTFLRCGKSRVRLLSSSIQSLKMLLMGPLTPSQPMNRCADGSPKPDHSKPADSRGSNPPSVPWPRYLNLQKGLDTRTKGPTIVLKTVPAPFSWDRMGGGEPSRRIETPRSGHFAPAHLPFYRVHYKRLDKRT